MSIRKNTNGFGTNIQELLNKLREIGLGTKEIDVHEAVDEIRTVRLYAYIYDEYYHDDNKNVQEGE